MVSVVLLMNLASYLHAGERAHPLPVTSKQKHCITTERKVPVLRKIIALRVIQVAR